MRKNRLLFNLGGGGALKAQYNWVLGQSAFTLAEVLITLGIIGVVAAMTIPTLMSKIQWMVLKQQYKSTVSTLNQALRLVYEKDDTMYACHYEVKLDGTYGQGPGTVEECKALYESLKQVLKVATVCENKAYEKGCIPEYNGIDKISTDDGLIAGCDGYKTNNILNRNVAWVLTDGRIIGFYGPLSSPYTKVFYVDINGKKGPNKWGYDVFGFRINGESEKLFVQTSGCWIPEHGGKWGSDMMK